MKKLQFWVITESKPSSMDLEEGVGPYLLATIAKEAGYDVSVCQASQYGCDTGVIVAQIKEFSPDILSFSIFSGGVNLLRQILSRANLICPIIIGGPGATSDPIQVLSEVSAFATADKPIVLVQSEGESAFAALLRTSSANWNTIRRCWRLSDEGNVLSGQFGALSDINEKPLVDLSPSVLRHECERLMRDDSAPLAQRIRAIQALQHCCVETRRGCFFQCEYCSEPQLTVKGVRKVSPERAVKEVTHLFTKFGITFFNYIDNIAFEDEAWWRMYAELLRQLPYHHLLQFGGYGTPKFFSKRTWLSDTLPLLYDVGLSFVTLGVQSGSRRVLKDIIHRPPDDPENALEVVRRCVPLGLVIKTDFIVGHPTETVEDLQMTYLWIKRLYEAGAQIFVRRLGIVPGSGYDFKLRERKYTLPEQNEKSETIVRKILRHHGRKDAFLKVAAQNRTLPNLFFIDRQRHVLFPKPQQDRDTISDNAEKASKLSEPLRERFSTLFDLTLKSRSMALITGPARE